MKMLLGMLAIVALLVGCEHSRSQSKEDAANCRVSKYTLGDTIVCSLDCQWRGANGTGYASALPVSCEAFGSKVVKQ